MFRRRPPLAIGVVGGLQMKFRQDRTVRRGVEAARQLESQRLLVEELVLRGARDGAVVGEARRILVSRYAGVFGGAQVVLVAMIRRRKTRSIFQSHHVQARAQQQSPACYPGGLFRERERGQRLVETEVRNLELAENGVQ